MNSLAFTYENYSPSLQKFLAIYASFDHNTINQLPDIYQADAVFIDPVHKVSGLEAIERYFKKMSKALVSCEFEYSRVIESGNIASVVWVMTFRHKKLNSGRIIRVDGVSHLEFVNGKVCQHVDYYDLGAMVYENIPLVGGVIKKIKHQLARD